MTIRRAGVEDAEAVAGVQVRSWRAAYRGIMPQSYLDGLDTARRADRWARWIGDADWPREAMLVAEDAGDMVAFASFGPLEDTPDVPEVAAFYSVPEVWGTGVNQRLMGAVTDALGAGGYTEAVLWVLSANDRARRFYAAQGWRADDGIERSGPINGVYVHRVRFHRVLDGAGAEGGPWG
ncbi:GNAT family N-acetyltransferase [Nocardiopsis aegyptia]|uniref:GNAT family N-acetyltransferase n=1 Tax=Nocardiopsis aegyptia TaxID=220378 RepID=UPI00367350F0